MLGKELKELIRTFNVNSFSIDVNTFLNQDESVLKELLHLERDSNFFDENKRRLLYRIAISDKLTDNVKREVISFMKSTSYEKAKFLFDFLSDINFQCRYITPLIERIRDLRSLEPVQALALVSANCETSTELFTYTRYLDLFKDSDAILKTVTDIKTSLIGDAKTRKKLNLKVIDEVLLHMSKGYYTYLTSEEEKVQALKDWDITTYDFSNVYTPEFAELSINYFGTQAPVLNEIYSLYIKAVGEDVKQSIPSIVEKLSNSGSTSATLVLRIVNLLSANNWDTSKYIKVVNFLMALDDEHKEKLIFILKRRLLRYDELEKILFDSTNINRLDEFIDRLANGELFDHIFSTDHLVYTEIEDNLDDPRELEEVLSNIPDEADINKYTLTFRPKKSDNN